MRLDYQQLPGFEDIYLEDSYVLAIQTYPFAVVFLLDVVLQEAHPLYENPPADEQYCYRTMQLLFTDVKEMHWLEMPSVAFEDANDDVDYGNIDAFWYEDGHYHLTGDWGRLDVVASPPTLATVDREMLVH